MSSREYVREIAAVLVGIIAMGYFYFKHQRIVDHGSLLRFKVVGYDPRDLLSGYYLRYQVDYGKKICSDSSQEVCVCFQPDKPPPHRASKVLSCSLAASSCGVYLKGDCQRGRFVAGIERYYIPESKRNVVAVIPEGATINVRVGDEGKGVTEAFFIKGESLEDYLIRKGGKP